MRHRRWLPLLLLGLSAAELAVFVLLGNEFGYGWTILVMLLVTLVGLGLLRREGLRAWRGFQEAAAAGTPPGPRVADGLVGLAGALLLASPGLVSATVGATVLLPPVRRRARQQVQARAERRMSSSAADEVFGPRHVRVRQGHHPAGADTEVVEGEIVDGPGR